MSVEHLELVLHELTTRREGRKLYREDARRYLEGFELSEEERAPVLNGDVLALYRLGVSPLLVMGFWVDTLRRPIAEYVRAMNAASARGAG